MKQVFRILFLCILGFSLLFNTLNAEPGGVLGYASVSEHNGKKVLIINNGSDSHRFRFEELGIPEKVNALDISDALKKQALTLYQKFTHDFLSVQAGYERAVTREWFSSLDLIQAENQEFLEPVKCFNLELPFTMSEIYTRVNFEINNQFSEKMQRLFGENYLEKNDNFVVVYLTLDQVNIYEANTKMISLSDTINSFDTKIEKDVLIALRADILEGRLVGNDRIFLAPRELAKSLDLKTYQKITGINFIPSLSGSPLMSINFSKEHLLDSAEAGDSYFIQEYLSKQFSRPEQSSNLDRYSSGEVKETSGAEKPFELPDFRTITFYKEDGIQIKTRFDGGLKEDGDFLSPSGYYGQTDFETSYRGVKLSLITKVDTESITPNEFHAEYEVFDQDDNLSLKLQWQIMGEEENDFVFDPDISNLNNSIQVKMSIKF